ncbi:hypothetical protein [Maritimibacter sp. DP1N21-5]|uniref:hypothetical protein n=1 Tax=Maritimibacter sp. DP1N21-5 TaxID=2836867 RepID=UPI001C45B4C9|nr:hypothetical protein [Maritimibacter sp. DP1N21-5]MBV7408772.1 hypothetical protein [Maritimibacter sp. DP1N21-5]
MSMFANGIGAFIDGAFQGVEDSRRWKRENKQEERDDIRFDREQENWDWEDENRSRTREDWGWQDETRNNTRKDWNDKDQQRARDAAEREFWREIAGGDGTGGDTDPDTPARPAQAPGGATAPASAPTPPARVGVGAVPQRPQAPDAPAPTAPQAAPAPAGRPAGIPGTPIAAPAPTAPSAPAPRLDVSGIRTVEDAAAAGLPPMQTGAETDGYWDAAVMGGDQSYMVVGGARYPLDSMNTRRSGVIPEAAPTPRMPDSGAGQPPMPRQPAPTVEVLPTTPNTNVDSMGRVLGFDFNNDVPQAPTSYQAEAPAQPPEPAAPVSYGPPRRTAPTEAAPVPRPQAPAAPGSPDRAPIASPDAAPGEIERPWHAMRRARGGVDGRMVDPETSERMAEFTLGRWMEDKSEAIIRHYLETGDIDKARQFETFLKDDKTKAGMLGWAAALNAASMGDDRGFVEGLTKAYNSTGYFDDGYEIVPAQSGLDRDQGGNIVGATVTFKDTKSGRTFKQVFDDVEDIYEAGLAMTSPERVFEEGWTQTQNAEAKREALREAAVKAGADSASLETILEVGKYLGENSLEFSQLPAEEQLAQIIQFLNVANGARGGVTSENPAAPQVPVMR